MPKIALLGYGKMGKTIEQLALDAGDEIVLRLNADNATALTARNLQQADVAIDFSHPQTGFKHVEACLKAGVPVVSGTTGWLDRFEEAKTHCLQQKGAFFYASNFSIGVNLFFALNQKLAELMNDWPAYQPSMTEIHHTQKLDAPSGTAITLSEDIAARLKRVEGWHEGTDAAEGQIPIQAIREEEVKGTHEIRYASAVDTITIRHEAHSREGFAKGALQAAHWLIGRKGVFGMSDMLGL
ncbi:MAG: 4-hydroxy-tetrahydrodipicolinate reductase [Phaeodactylibacter sp.]|uniref:4-hydroxy-tetrahydrodipicolinate reductase n=1 Tax=Phaeodactylibacter sp. TaxID=1940289 RepID=UPI0032ED79BF